MRRLLFALIAILCLAPLQAAPRETAPVAIEDASWLAGRWVGEGLGGEIEEVWSPPRGGQMVGHFALRREGIPVFYELMLLDLQPDGLRLRVKHFNPDFTAWEDRDGWHSFEPDRAEPGKLRFQGLAFERSGEALLISIRLRDRSSGAVQDHLLRLRRSPL